MTSSPPLTPQELSSLDDGTRRLYEELPPELSRETKLGYNSHTAVNPPSVYAFEGMEFDVYPQVMRPGATSEVLFKLIWDEKLPVRGARYLVMGSGTGVETVLAAKRGAREIHAIDIDPGSIAATRAGFDRHVPETPSLLNEYVSDLFAGYSGGTVDLITFNPPAVALEVPDPVRTRISFSGPSIMFRFLREIAEKRLLEVDGLVAFVVSNTTDLKGIFAAGVRAGFGVELIERLTWPAPYDELTTLVFGMRPKAAA